MKIIFLLSYIPLNFHYFNYFHSCMLVVVRDFSESKGPNSGINSEQTSEYSVCMLQVFITVVHGHDCLSCL